MTQEASAPLWPPGHTLDTMISLTRLAAPHRVIAAGSDSMELYLALRRRGFVRVSTPAICRVARAQHAVGLVSGQSSDPGNSSLGIESVLDQISPFLAANANLARVEQIKRFHIVEGDWLPGGDELTPTMKLKRKPIAEKYAGAIEAMYSG